MAKLQDQHDNIKDQTAPTETSLAGEDLGTSNVITYGEGISLENGNVSFKDSYHYAANYDSSNCCENRLKAFLSENPQIGVSDIEAVTTTTRTPYYIGRVRKIDTFDKTDSITATVSQELIDPSHNDLPILVSNGVEQLRDNLYLVIGSVPESAYERLSKFQETADITILKTVPIDQTTQQRHRTRALLVLTDSNEIDQT